MATAQEMALMKRDDGVVAGNCVWKMRASKRTDQLPAKGNTEGTTSFDHHLLSSRRVINRTSALSVDFDDIFDRKKEL